MSIRIRNVSNIKKELLTLAMLRYNRSFYKNKNKEKFLDFHKQVDMQEFYLYYKYRIIPMKKKEKDIIITLNHLSHQFHNPKYPYIVYNTGYIFRKNRILKNYIFPHNLNFPIKIKNNVSYCNVNREVYNYFILHFSVLESF